VVVRVQTVFEPLSVSTSASSASGSSSKYLEDLACGYDADPIGRGVKVYVHAVIDNYSRRILAWQANESYDTSTTSKLLVEAAKGLEGVVPMVYMDSGVENLNANVDALVASGTIQRILAQVDVVFSNSMIESWWRMLKHWWLYLNTLESLDDVRKQTTFYVDQHNRVIPHSAFKGQTPDEMCFGNWNDIPNQLSDARTVAS